MLIVYLESNYTLHQHACIHIIINTINTQLMFYLQLYYIPPSLREDTVLLL